MLKSYQPELNRLVALKVLAPHPAYVVAARKRFAREAKAAAAIVHPSVMPILAVDSSGLLPFLVMPYADCEFLQERFDSADQLAALLEECFVHVQQPSTAPLPRSLRSTQTDAARQRSQRLVGGSILASLLAIGVGLAVIPKYFGTPPSLWRCGASAFSCHDIKDFADDSANQQKINSSVFSRRSTRDWFMPRSA